MVVETQLEELAQLQVFDVMGKKAYEQAFDGDISYESQKLDLNKLHAGSSFIPLRAGGKTFVKQVMIQAGK